MAIMIEKAKKQRKFKESLYNDLKALEGSEVYDNVMRRGVDVIKVTPREVEIGYLDKGHEKYETMTLQNFEDLLISGEFQVEDYASDDWYESKKITITKPIMLENKLIRASEENPVILTVRPAKKEIKKMNEKYNGWTNYETWNINLWVTNEEVIYNDMMNHRGMWTANGVEDFVVEWFPEGTPDMDRISDYRKVNWQEIADNWNEG
jgi:hypothetical protein